MKKGMDVIISGHKGWVEYIKGREATEPVQKEPELVVWISIDSPHWIGGFGITLPLKEYAPDELKKLIEKEGTRQWDDKIAKHEAERKKTEDIVTRRKEAEDIARKVAEAAGVELLSDRR